MLADLEKAMLDQVLNLSVRYGRLKVTYWDGDTWEYIGQEGKDEPFLSVKITDRKVVRRLPVNASLAIGEAYTRGDLQIDEEDLPLFFKLVAMNSPRTDHRQPYLKARNRKRKQKKYIQRHYDVGNDYYELLLGDTMVYSCAYFKTEEDSLDQAQRQKIMHLLRKLRLGERKGLKVLDIGCGWGHLAVAAALAFDAEVTGITLSDEQLAYARKLAIREGVEDRVTFKDMNYQDLKGEQFDRIISVGMFEHVGKDNYGRYFSKVNELLVPGGVSVLHTITQLRPRPTDAWVDKYIFPGGYLPTVAEIEKELAEQGFFSVDREDLAQHYAKTLDLWRQRHRECKEKIVAMFDGKFKDMSGEEFYRMRDFWLACSAAGFRDGKLGLNQTMFTKGKVQDGPLTREFLYTDE